MLASGCFDGLHAGHVAYLRAAADLCEALEPLVVAVASDAYVKAAKGRSPHWTCSDRTAVITTLKCVDLVVAHGDGGAADAIRVLRPRLFVKGGDWQRKGLPDADVLACAEVGAVIVFVEEVAIAHTSEIFH